MTHAKRLALSAALLLGLSAGACVNVSSQEMVAEREMVKVADARHTAFVSPDSFAVVESRLRSGIASRPLTLFTVVDHGQGAREVGTPIGESKLFLVGNPEVGTPFMVADPQMGLDLPLKILIHTAEDGTHLAYSHPGVAAEMHGVAARVEPQIAKIHETMRGLLRDAGGSSVRMVEE